MPATGASQSDQCGLQGAINKAAPANVLASCQNYSNTSNPLKLLYDYAGGTGGSPVCTSASLPVSTVTFNLGSYSGTFSPSVTVQPTPTGSLPSGVTSNPAVSNSGQTYTFYYNTISRPMPRSKIKKSRQSGARVFTVQVLLQNFAQYGLFSGSQTDASNNPVWFSIKYYI